MVKGSIFYKHDFGRNKRSRKEVSLSKDGLKLSWKGKSSGGGGTDRGSPGGGLLRSASFGSKTTGAPPLPAARCTCSTHLLRARPAAPLERAAAACGCCRCARPRRAGRRHRRRSRNAAATGSGSGAARIRCGGGGGGEGEGRAAAAAARLRLRLRRSA